MLIRIFVICLYFIDCSCKEHTRAHLDDCLFIPFGDILRCREKRYEPVSTLQETIKVFTDTL